MAGVVSASTKYQVITAWSRYLVAIELSEAWELQRLVGLPYRPADKTSASLVSNHISYIASAYLISQANNEAENRCLEKQIESVLVQA